MSAGAVVLVVALVTLLWGPQPSDARAVTAAAASRLAVAGGDGGGLPLAEPELEHLDAAALERAARDPAAAGLQAFLVTRHGHLIFARYGHGIDGETVVDSGGFARVLPLLLAGIAVQGRALPADEVARLNVTGLRSAIERGTHQSYVDYLSRRLWSRLNAGTAWIELPSPGATPPVDCCFEARVEDWLRVGGLLVNDGSFEDTPVLRPGWIARIQRRLFPGYTGWSSKADEGGRRAQPRRSGSYQAADVLLLRGPGHWRLWAIPSLKLVILFGAPGSAGAWDETRLPNLVIDAVTDRTASQPSELPMRRVPGLRPPAAADQRATS